MNKLILACCAVALAVGCCNIYKSPDFGRPVLTDEPPLRDEVIREALDASVLIRVNRDGLTVSQASGFTVRRSDRYFVWSCYHVFDRRMDEILIEQYRVGLDDKTVIYTVAPAKIVLALPEADMALLRIESTVNQYGDSRFDLGRAPSIGDPVFVIGNVLGDRFPLSLSEGVISGLGRESSLTPGLRLNQTDATIIPGNSGGAVLDARTGSVEGIVVSKLRDTVGFFIPTSVVVAEAKNFGLYWAIDPNGAAPEYILE